MVQIETIGNIYNNIKKGLMEKNTLIALQGSARSGKTYNTIIFLIECCLRATVDVSIVRNSLPVLKRSAFKDFCDIMLRMGLWKSGNMNKTEMKYYFDNGSVVEFFATDGPEGAQKSRGSRRDILFCNEANEIDEENFRQLRMRTSKFTIVDFNPSFTEEHWLFKILSDERTYHFVSTFIDNPFLPDAIREEIMSYKYTNPQLWQIFGEGKFAIVEGLIFPRDTWDTYRETDMPIYVKERRIGIDFGYSNDPTAIVDCHFATIEGVRHIWAKEVCYEPGLKTKQIAYRLKEYNGVMKFSESADPRLIDELEDEGVSMLYPVKKYSGSLVVGIQKLQGCKLHIESGSSNLQKEMRNYCWQKDRHDTYMNVPIDKFNHLIDALRYAATDVRSRKAEGTFLRKEDFGFDF